ncbi:DUF4383 domain-containing protein [Amycolatopsis albispora]|uniref:DUF4383 domain-containing protein n=1 Tax=Amycolatopsis albispora TaxID=1804986 RepID=A0A344L362_9PSEU|nr:DUF4383 domain-containing protein [Amycolatopsis albispora]AXB42486.1 hypothetical protein A4R43_08075 [Amycolatopsis albispora]
MPTSRTRRPIQFAALLVGVAFLVVGVLGFIPGITSGDLHFAGPHSAAELFGAFQVSVLHNLVHLLFGVLGIAAFAGPWPARTFLMVGGGLYLVLWIYGLALDDESPVNFIPVNNADNWLHLGLGAAMVALGLSATAAERAKGEYPRDPAGSDG